MKSQNFEKAKGKFLSDMSREIQNSVKIILSRSDYLKQTDLTSTQAEYVDTIYKSANKLSWVVNDVLDFSQLELGKIELQSIEFNLEYLINDIFKSTVAREKDHPVDTYIDIGKDVPHNLVGDPTRLRQVLVNLLSNAFKFTPKGEIGVIVKNAGDQVPDGSAGKEKVNLRFIIKDSGKGIPKDQVDSVFELDGREKSSKSWEFGGTGLGLVICKLVVEAMGGKIHAESEEGKGSTFMIDLSFGKGTLLRERKVYPLTRSELVGRKAIIVDDNEIARKILKKCCETMGIETVLISASPKEVLQELDKLSDRGEIPDLILCDIMMPEMDGYEMIQRVLKNEKCKNIKTIAVTSAVHVGSAQNAQKSGFSGFLPKPVFLDELAKVITTVLGDKREKKTIVTRHMAEELKFQGTKVLIVGGTGEDQKSIEECLSLMECEREFSLRGQEAIECLKEKIYDLCLLDYCIVEEEGAEIIRLIKEISRNLPTVAVLTADMEKNRSECLYAGIDDFIIKPIDMTNLKRIIKRYGKN